MKYINVTLTIILKIPKGNFVRKYYQSKDLYPVDKLFNVQDTCHRYNMGAYRTPDSLIIDIFVQNVDFYLELTKDNNLKIEVKGETFKIKSSGNSWSFI